MFVDIIDHSFRIVRKNRSTYFYIPEADPLHFSPGPAGSSGPLRAVDINLTCLLAERFSVPDNDEKNLIDGFSENVTSDHIGAKNGVQNFPAGWQDRGRQDRGWQDPVPLTTGNHMRESHAVVK